MSHMVKGTTNLSVENAEILIEALQAAYEGCTIERNTQARIYGNPMCDIVVKRRNGRDVGFRANSEGNYDCLTYEPGYRSDAEAVREVLRPVYEHYVKGVAQDMIKRNPNLRNYVMGKEVKEVERNGKKMKRVRIQAAGGRGGYI